MTTPRPLLDVAALSLSLATPQGPVRVLDGVTLSIGEGECVAVIGESGAGKTMLARALAGFVPPGARLAGSIRFLGEELSATGARTDAGVRGAGIGLVHQDPQDALAPHRTVGSQIADVLLAHGARSRAAAREGALALLARVAIPDPMRRYGEYPFELSGGLRQRAALALALAPRPALLIADEPTSALDPLLAVELVALLEQLRRAQDVALLLVSHDLGVVGAIAGRVLVLYGGSVVEEAPVDALYAHPRHPYSARLYGRAGGSVAGERDEVAVRGGGCAYRGACPLAAPVCDTAPPWLTIGVARVRCHRPLGAGT